MPETDAPDDQFRFAKEVLALTPAHDAAEQVEAEPNPGNIDAQIAELERQNEIFTPAQRLLVASLLVEPTFLYPAVITGQSEGVEHAFGKERWANYLKARSLTKTYQGPLTLDFVLNVYGILLEKVDPDEIIQDTKPEEGHLGIGSNAGQPYPMTCTDSQIAIISANKYTEWLPVTRPGSDVDDPRLSEIHPIAPHLLTRMGWSVTNEPSNLGFINYVAKTKNEKLRGLADIIGEYNRAKDSPHDPDELATSLERGIVSLHAGRDGNGTAAGLFMNWSLERDSLGPSIPYPDDLLATEERHISYVRQGRAVYERSRQKVEAGETDPVVIFGLENERAHFEESTMTVPKLEQGKLHERAVFEEFLRTVSFQG